jgi:septum formation inhibitor-activating ATPase MinD
MSTTTVTSPKQPVGQTTRAAETTTMMANMNEPVMSKDAGNMATTEATE